MNKKKRLSNFMLNAFYHSKFKDTLFVVKAGGEIIQNDKARNNLIANIKDLTLHGIRVLLIYGGGTATDQALDQRGISIQKEQGRRITDKNTLQVMKEILGGDLCLRVSQSMAEQDLEGLSLNAVPHDWLDIHLRPKQPVDYGFVGDIHGTSPRPVFRLFRFSNFVACACLAFTQDGQLVNINADTIATELAIGTKANKLIFLSNVDGVLNKQGQTLSMLTDSDIFALIDNGTAQGGMKVKLENCTHALNHGVRRIHMINGFQTDALKKEIFEAIGLGTMIISEAEQENYANEIELQKVIGV